MSCSPRLTAGLLLLVLTSTSALAAPPSFVDHQVRYAPERFRTVAKDGGTIIEMKGATRTFEAGRPDLPVASELIEIPAGTRVTGIEVRALATEPLGTAARVPAAVLPRPGLQPVERSAEDPAWYRRAGFPPVSEAARLGVQGSMRGRNFAAIEVNPVRWDAASGRLERVSRLDVRLILEPFQDAAVLRRERIVPEWESDAAFAASRAALAGGRDPQPFKPTQVPSVLGSPVAYVIITTDALAAEFQRLADWKTQSGVPAVVRTLSFIQQNYPFGADDADRMRQFIRDCYTRWGTKWVLIGGDTEIMPYRVIRTTFFGGENIPCDLYFSSLDGTWNADGDALYGEGYATVSNPGDAADLMPEVYVGRAPVVTVPDVQRFVNKNFQYTRTPVGDYEHTVHFFAEVLFPADWEPFEPTSLDGAELVEDVLPYLMAHPSVYTLRQLQNYTDPRWTPGARPESRALVIDSVNAGYNMTIHIGHGYRSVMSVADANLTNADVLALANGNRLTNLYSTNCTSNAIDFPAIGEAWLGAANGGAVTNIGSTRFDFPYSARAFQEEYFKLVYQDSVNAVGEAQAKQKIPFIGSSTSDNINRWTETTMLLLGDPELRQWTGAPRTLTVTHPPTYALGETTMTVNVKIGATDLYGARVTVHKPGDDYRSVTTDGAGNAVLEFRPGSTGTFYLTVSAYDSRPVQDTLVVAPGVAAVLADVAPTVNDTDDDGPGGRVGNGNGFFDSGETVDVTVPVTNNGGAAALNANGTLSTSDGLVTIVTPTATYGSIAPTATASGTAYRVSLPFTAADQREIPFTLSLANDGGGHHLQRFRITTRAAEPAHLGHSVSDPTGNNNGIADAGETISLALRLRNLGTGHGGTLTAVLRSYDGLCTITDSSAVFVNATPGSEVTGDPFEFVYSSTAAKLDLVVSNVYGVIATHKFDLVRPNAPTNTSATGSASSITVKWTPPTASPDVRGYNVYHSFNNGPYTKVNAVPTDRTSYYEDSGLLPLTRYFYFITAVDSSGNESGLSPGTDTSTNPPKHAIFPVEMDRATPAPVAVDYVWQATMMDIVAGAQWLWAWRADGAAHRDADATAITHGDFTTRGAYYAAGASLGKVDGVSWSIAAPSWDSLGVYLFDRDGNVRPGWPVPTVDPVWSAVSMGDLDNDGDLEMVFGSNGSLVYALRADGTEWMDGDSNPGTTGVFKVLSGSFNPGTPGIADLDANGVRDIVYAGADGNLHVWRPDGSNLTGFPVMLTPNIRSSVAIGYLDGLGDTQVDIVVLAPNDSLYVIRADGSRRPGFPVFVPVDLMSKNPSPAIADMNADGFADIVAAGSNGRIYVVDRNGVFHAGFASSRYSVLTSFASEGSPVVADINGDGLPDVVMGDEEGVLNGISGTGAPLPGFPIQLGGEVRGVGALCDCDSDGMSEIVISSWDTNTYMWDYDFTFSPAGAPSWPQFMHDARRTGFAANPAFVDVETPAVAAPPARIELAAPSPNPARESSRIAWAVPADRAGAELDVSVYDLAGRRITTLAHGVAEAGRFTTDWNLRTFESGRVGGGIYFVRLRLGPSMESRKLVVMP